MSTENEQIIQELRNVLTHLGLTEKKVNYWIMMLLMDKTMDPIPPIVPEQRVVTILVIDGTPFRLEINSSESGRANGKNIQETPSGERFVILSVAGEESQLNIEYLNSQNSLLFNL